MKTGNESVDKPISVIIKRGSKAPKIKWMHTMWILNNLVYTVIVFSAGLPI